MCPQVLRSTGDKGDKEQGRKAAWVIKWMLILTEQHKVLFYTGINSDKALYIEKHILKWNLRLI